MIPEVTIQATDPFASWSGNPGLFTVTRAGNPTPWLHVYYEIGGSATNGQDYRSIGHWVDLPSGVLSADIRIDPTNASQTLTETVVLTLTNSPLMQPLGASMPVNYLIGSPSSATVYIGAGQRTNLPPVATLVWPTNGAVFYRPASLPLVACARDADGTVASVEFFADNLSLGIVTNSPRLLPAIAGPTPLMPPYQPFVLVWSNVPPGTNVLLTAKATDDEGASTLSAPVSITICSGPPPTPTNLPPVVRISSPASGASFRAPADIPIFAYAKDSAGAVGSVEFFAGTTSLGLGHLVMPYSSPGTPLPLSLSSCFTLVWSNAPAGDCELTAKATDKDGLSAVSSPVSITVLPPALPPSNRTDVVSIVATDPIALEGTNCWPWIGLAGAPPTWSNWTASSAVCRYLTNCAPKNATFSVRRFGVTNAALTVSYTVGGTASNGVDYAALPGSVIIPAGQRQAMVTVVPLDDGTPDANSTVVLTLNSDAVTAANQYSIGFPPRAAALILDSRWPARVPLVLPDKSFRVNATGPSGAWFHIEYTADLLHWTPVCTNQVVNGAIDFIDPDASTAQVRFYRAVPEANPPQP